MADSDFTGEVMVEKIRITNCYLWTLPAFITNKIRYIKKDLILLTKYHPFLE